MKNYKLFITGFLIPVTFVTSGLYLEQSEYILSAIYGLFGVTSAMLSIAFTKDEVKRDKNETIMFLSDKIIELDTEISKLRNSNLDKSMKLNSLRSTLTAKEKIITRLKNKYE